MNILIIGCGNMGGAMLAGWLAAGLAPETFTVVDPVLAEAPAGVPLLREVPAGTFSHVLLGVKPQALDAVAPSVEPAIGPDTVLLSILAGIEIASLAARFPRAKGLVRVMPNLAAAIGKSPIALYAEELGDSARDGVSGLMAQLGQVEWIAEEALFDAVTALSGCGPAFLYRFIDAMALAATGLGIDEGQAQRLALATVEGAALLAAQSPHGPGELARRVASPGGATQQGLDVLDHGAALANLMAATLRAARDRSADMAAEARAAG